MSTVGCETGVAHVYDSLYKPISKETVRLIGSLVYSPCSELRVTMMDVEKHSDCGVFDLCRGCTVRFDHSWQRALKIVRFPVFLCWVRERVP